MSVQEKKSYSIPFLLQRQASTAQREGRLYKCIHKETRNPKAWPKGEEEARRQWGGEEYI
jgi:hypothetical protein